MPINGEEKNVFYCSQTKRAPQMPMGEWHRNMYNIIYETNHQSRFDARYWMLGAGALGRPRRIVRGGRREGVSGWGAHVHPCWIHVDVWQN